jgi:hypothetical protein
VRRAGVPASLRLLRCGMEPARHKWLMSAKAYRSGHGAVRLDMSLSRGGTLASACADMWPGSNLAAADSGALPTLAEAE